MSFQIAQCSTPRKPSKLGGSKVLRSQSREIVYNVFKFMKEEAEHGIKQKLTGVHTRVCAATGVSLSTLKRIIKEGETNLTDGNTFSTPNKTRHRTKTKSVLDDFDKCALRRIIYNFHKTKGELPTLKTLLPVAQSELDFHGSRWALRKIVRSMGFRWRKTKTNRKILIEKNDVRDKRLSYLRSVAKYRSQNRPIIYIDETYIHSSHTKSCAWSDESSETLTVPVSKGQRAIILHAGGQEGFIKNAFLVFKSGTKSGDYHQDMNFNNFYKWLKDKLIPNLPQNSVIVMDNASYHNVFSNPAPTSSSSKADMIKWLLEHGIPFHNTLLKPELYALIKSHKPSYNTYKVDLLLSEHGHSVLRLPPYHPDLNPIELIWAIIKEYVARKNVTFNLNDAIKLLQEKVDLITADDWLSRCQKVVEIEKNYLEAENFIDNISEELIININGDSSEDCSEFSDSDGDN